MGDVITTSACGAKSSPVPRLDLIPYRALVSMAARFEKGLQRYDRNNWRKGTGNLEYVLERLAHLQAHAAILSEKLQGIRPDDGDDDVGAILWAGAFLAEAQFALECQKDDVADVRKKIAESGLLHARAKRKRVKTKAKARAHALPIVRKQRKATGPPPAPSPSKRAQIARASEETAAAPARVLALLAEKPMTSGEIIKALRPENYSATSIYVALSNFRAQGKIEPWEDPDTAEKKNKLVA